ncbi:unnamed protein product [Calypogeia fissa]
MDSLQCFFRSLTRDGRLCSSFNPHSGAGWRWASPVGHSGIYSSWSVLLSHYYCRNSQRMIWCEVVLL